MCCIIHYSEKEISTQTQHWSLVHCQIMANMYSLWEQ